MTLIYEAMMAFPTDSLVLYKNRPARVLLAGDRLELELESGRTQKVRPKDVELLHPGPLKNLAQLQPQQGELETAWELLEGDTTTIEELAALLYGAYTPSTAWAAWQVVADSLYFCGTPDSIQARPPDQVAQEQARRREKLEQERVWNAFLGRVRQGQILPQDQRHLSETEQLALGKQPGSRLLREMGRAETPENAHALLLELGHWDFSRNPHPVRLDVPTDIPDPALSFLPPEDRRDLTHLRAFAIDDEGNQDPDDALSIEGTRLWVHVADVAALVAPDSPADLEARARGANLYLPEGTAPMLPPQATQALGLGLAELSPALSFGLELDSAGEVTGLEITPSWVRVERLTYEQVESRLEEEPFKTLHRLALAARQRRQRRGAVFIDWPEVKVRVEGERVRLTPLLPLKSRELVAEAMLMAGQAAARFALERGLAFPFSTQEPPGESGPFPEGLAGSFARRRTLRRSQLKSVHGSHAGLGLEAYAQATSPLRRYLDLVVHQQLRACLLGGRTLGAGELLQRVGAAQAVTGAVRQAERQSVRHWTLVYLLERLGSRWEGILVEKRERRATLVIPELGLEVGTHLSADFPLNAAIPLQLLSVDLPRLEAHFQVISVSSSPQN